MDTHSIIKQENVDFSVNPGFNYDVRQNLPKD
ncbi:MAG: hypothetical protein LEGION0398_MBIBDBAK_00214 [Legionellaceae bacterium]